MKGVAIVGAGYVGLTTAAGLAKNKNLEVFVIERNKTRLESLKRGECPIIEPGLKEALFVDNVFFGDESVLKGTVDYAFICTGTPPEDDGSVDLSQVKSAGRMITPYMHHDGIVFIRSTVPPGTTRQLKASMELENAKYVPIFCHHPEFLQQGTAMADFEKCERVVFGCVDSHDVTQIEDAVNHIYPKAQGVRIVHAESSELAKYANNAFLATKISFANEIARVADATGAVYEHVRDVIGDDPRIGKQFLSPGIGYGGSCLPKDVQGLRSVANDHGIRMPAIEGAMLTNLSVEYRLERELIKLVKDKEERGWLIVDGMSFKSGTDDLRNSVIVQSIINAMLEYPKFRVIFIDAMALDSGSYRYLEPFRSFSMDRIEVVRDYAMFSASAYYGLEDLHGIVLSKERVEDPHGLLKLVRRTTCPILDCRPTREKFDMLPADRYKRFVG